MTRSRCAEALFSLPFSFLGTFLVRQQGGFNLVSCQISPDQLPTPQQFPSAAEALFGEKDVAKTLLYLFSTFVNLFVNPCCRTACCLIPKVNWCLSVSFETKGFRSFFHYTQTFFIFHWESCRKPFFCLSPFRS